MSLSSANRQARLGSRIITVFFLIAGVVTLYDTSHYSDTDSKIFPQAVATALIVFAGLSLIGQFLRPIDGEGFGRGIWWRRILLVVALLLACLAMPYVGFLPAGAIAFSGGLVAAMHERWSIRTVLLYWGSGLVVMVSFFVLFKWGLQVPLP